MEWHYDGRDVCKIEIIETVNVIQDSRHWQDYHRPGRKSLGAPWEVLIFFAPTVGMIIGMNSYIFATPHSGTLL